MKWPMAVRSVTRYQTHTCVLVIISFIILHMIFIDDSYSSPQQIQESYIRLQENHSQKKKNYERGFTLPSLDEEIELNYIHTELTDEIKKNHSISNSIQMIKNKLQKEEELRKIEDKKIKSLHEKTDGDSESFIDIKPFINFTLNAFGVFDDINEEEPFDPKDSMRMFHSMFQIWNPKASRWASDISKTFKHNIRRRGQETGNVSSVKYPSLKEKLVKIEECGCVRKILVEDTRHGSLNDSTCSKASFQRGGGQKVIGFSFYGNPNSTKSKERKYFQGIADNLDLLPHHYPSWIIRVYYDLEPDDPELRLLCDLACSNPSLDICHVRSNPASGDISQIFAMNWRFFPTLDPNVDMFVSRDLDSRINSREKAAVEDWYKTKKHFHFMRDHPAHGIEILGSGWGVRLGPQRSEVRRVFREAWRTASHDTMFWAARKAYGPDQGFLKRYIWPWAKWTAVSHDAYFCKQFPRTTPFPTRRKNSTNNFVAAIVEAGDWLVQECPEACRPPGHRDWTTC